MYQNIHNIHLEMTFVHSLGPITPKIHVILLMQYSFADNIVVRVYCV